MAKTTGMTKFAAVLLAIAGVVGIQRMYSEPPAVCPPLGKSTLWLPDEYAEAMPDFRAKAQRLIDANICVTDGSYGKAYQKYYYSVYDLGWSKKPYILRFNRAQLKR